MPFATFEQTQTAIAELDRAIQSHEQWRTALTRTLVSRIPPNAVDMEPDAHLHCRFGQWYHGPAAAPLIDHAGFVSLGLEHRQVHDQAARLLRLVAQDQEVAPGDFDRFSDSLERMGTELHALREALAESLRNRDPLTGARTRTGMVADLSEQQALVRRRGHHCSLAMLDLDHFKQINDRHGHVAGDHVLAATAACIAQRLRPYDRLYRFGGEEFLLCLPDTTVAQAAELAERLREAIAMTPTIMEEHPPLWITASFGVCALDPDATIEQCLDRADHAMYAAKAAGRNCVRAWRADAPPQDAAARPTPPPDPIRTRH